MIRALLLAVCFLAGWQLGGVLPLRLLRAVAVYVGYWVRPYDMLADRRRWVWQRPQRCGCVILPESEARELQRAAAAAASGPATPRRRRRTPRLRDHRRGG